jgi:hypothetical protein
MTTWNIHSPNIIWRVSGGRYPTLYVARAKDENPLNIEKEVKIPVFPAFCRGENEIADGIQSALKRL